jgi:hypothetical protein
MVESEKENGADKNEVEVGLNDKAVAHAVITLIGDRYCIAKKLEYLREAMDNKISPKTALTVGISDAVYEESYASFEKRYEDLEVAEILKRLTKG